MGKLEALLMAVIAIILWGASIVFFELGKWYASKAALEAWATLKCFLFKS